jgi:hypothetical protein
LRFLNDRNAESKRIRSQSAKWRFTSGALDERLVLAGVEEKATPDNAEDASRETVKPLKPFPRQANRPSPTQQPARAIHFTLIFCAPITRLHLSFMEGLARYRAAGTP